MAKQKKKASKKGQPLKEKIISFDTAVFDSYIYVLLFSVTRMDIRIF